MNPYSPGPAKQPPLLAGREVAHRVLDEQLAEAQAGRGHQPVVLFGERGMGKTVLLDRTVREAQERGWAALRVEAQRDTPLGVALANELVELYHQLPGRLGRPPRWLRQFKVSFGGHIAGAEVQVAPQPKPDYGRPPSIYDSLAEIAQRASRPGRGVFVAVDEIHHAPMSDVRELGRLVQAANGEGWHFVLAAAGLSEIRLRILDEAPTYATRFYFQPVERLSPDDTKAAFVVPANQAGRLIDAAALDELVALTAGYPYFVQLYGRELWDVAEANPIVVGDVAKAHRSAMAVLDHGPYGASWGTLRPSERRFISAMAAVEAYPVQLKEVVGHLGLSVSSASSLRQRVMGSGLVEPAGHGLLSFAWPGYRQYVRALHPFDQLSAERPPSVGELPGAGPPAEAISGASSEGGALRGQAPGPKPQHDQGPGAER